MRNTFNYILVALLLTTNSCSSKIGRGKFREQVVPITINLKGNTHELNMVNLDLYRFKIVNDLQEFQKVDLQLVDGDENPEIVMDLDITSFIIWPKDERTSRRVFRRNIAVGTDAAGRPVYQTVTATVDITQTKIRSNARFVTRLLLKGEPTTRFQRTFAPTFVYSNITAGNIQGDIRAVDPSIVTSGSQIEPGEEDFLLALSRVETLRRLSDEIRKKYQ